MSVLVYAITEGRPLAAGGGEGVAGRPLVTVGEDGLFALVSEHDDPPAITEATLWAFEHVVEAQMSHQAVLPARFGSLVDDRQAVAALLGQRGEELREKLDRVRGAVELGVRAHWPAVPTEPRPSGPDAGTSYMLGHVTRDTRARELAARMDRELGPAARATRYKLLTRATLPVAASYLVERDRTDEFLARVETLATTIEDTELVCTGPWPPYSFVEAPSDD